MPTPYFGLNTQVGSPTVKRYLGLSATAVGNTFGTAETLDTTTQSLNRVIQFGGDSNTFLALQNKIVYRSTDAGVTWTQVFAPAASPSGYSSGLNVIYKNGIPTVCFIWKSTVVIGFSTEGRGSYSTDGITWVTDSGVPGMGIGSYISKDTIFRNTLYVASTASFGGDIEHITSYSPGSNLGNISLASYPTLCVFNDQLTVLRADSLLYTLSGGALQLRISSFPAAGGAPRYLGMFVDSNSGDLICFARKATSWGCYQVSASQLTAGTFTDISTTVIPLGMRSSVGASSRVLTFVDGEATPGSNPDKYLIYTDNELSGTVPSLYKWNGVSTEMSDIDSGGSSRDALTVATNCQGVGNWSSGENSIELLNRTPTSGGVILDYKAYGGGAVNIRAWFGTQLEEYETHAATLIGTTAITADGTARQITWNNAADGIATGSRFRMILEVYV